MDAANREEVRVSGPEVLLNDFSVLDVADDEIAFQEVAGLVLAVVSLEPSLVPRFDLQELQRSNVRDERDEALDAPGSLGLDRLVEARLR